MDQNLDGRIENWKRLYIDVDFIHRNSRQDMAEVIFIRQGMDPNADSPDN